jgi:hypothetical protein
VKLPGQLTAAAHQFFSALLTTLKLLRPQKRVEQVTKDENRNDQSNEIFQAHDYPLQTITCPNVKRRNYKEDYGNENEHKITHLNAPCDRLSKAQAWCQRYQLEMLVFLRGLWPALCKLQNARDFRLAGCKLVIRSGAALTIRAAT